MGWFWVPFGSFGPSMISSIYKRSQNAILLEKPIENHGFSSSAAAHFHPKNYKKLNFSTDPFPWGPRGHFRPLRPRPGRAKWGGIKFFGPFSGGPWFSGSPRGAPKINLISKKASKRVVANIRPGPDQSFLGFTHIWSQFGVVLGWFSARFWPPDFTFCLSIIQWVLAPLMTKFVFAIRCLVGLWRPNNLHKNPRAVVFHGRLFKV